MGKKRATKRRAGARAAVRGIPFEKLLAKQLKDPEFRHHYEQRRLVHEVAMAVRDMRDKAGMTQAQLAKLIGVSQPMIARIERGQDRRTPHFDTLRRIARALGKRVKLSFVADEREPLVEVDGLPVAPSPAAARE